MTDLMVVTGEPLSPAVHGGRIRAAHLVGELARRLDVTVVEGGDPTPGRRGTLSGRPRLGHAFLGGPRAETVPRALRRDRPRAVLFTHSYLAAMMPDLELPTIVDFQDVEGARMAALSRSGAWRSRAAFALEAGKARRWEPRVARRAALVSATSAADVDRLRAWGATAVWVPNGADRHPVVPSPARGPVTFVASLTYRPNRDAAQFLVEEVWPRLRRAEPDLRLRIVGRGADQAVGVADVEVIADPASVDAYYAEASVVLAPVVAGGGAQLKVTEALAHGRTLVATPYSAASVPDGAGRAVRVAAGGPAFTDAVVRAWRDTEDRWAREAEIDASAVPTWAEACAPLVDALVATAGTRSR